jgi:hypothetical protein
MMAVGVVAVFITTAVAMSRPGRTVIGKVVAMMSAAPAAKETASAEALPEREDVEQRARRKHGWTSGVTSWLARGSIIYYDAGGKAVEQWAVTVYRKYPEQGRIEINRGAGIETSGYDGTRAWRTGTERVSEEVARDIRAMIRLTPERLFVTRSRGASYRESGQRIEERGDSGVATFDEVEMDDALGEGDRRRVAYYINRESQMVESARWLEPDDPRRRIDDAGTALTDMRIDFGKWKAAGGVQWPMEIVKSKGGRMELRIELNEVVVNPQIADSIFQNR